MNRAAVRPTQPPHKGLFKEQFRNQTAATSSDTVLGINKRMMDSRNQGREAQTALRSVASPPTLKALRTSNILRAARLLGRGRVREGRARQISQNPDTCLDWNAPLTRRSLAVSSDHSLRGSNGASSFSSGACGRTRVRWSSGRLYTVQAPMHYF